MITQSVKAYDLPGRVASYDADMDLMHPNRAVMVRVALEVLPFDREAPLRALDLGSGTGYFTGRFLREFPNSRVIAVDGAASMIDLARTRLGGDAERVTFNVADFRDIRSLQIAPGSLDIVLSAYALHHLNAEDKRAVIRAAVDLLRPGGWFVNSDLIVSGSAEMEARMQQLRVDGIVRRAAGRDPRFLDEASTRQFLSDLERNEADQPLTFAQDLDILASSGLRLTAPFWLEYREFVCGGVK